MRLIDADALIEKFNEKCDMATALVDEKTAERFHTFCVLADAVDEQPTIDAEPVSHGHWIHTGKTNVYGGHQHACSVCGYSLMVSPMCDNENYCCNCGAKMDEERKEE